MTAYIVHPEIVLQLDPTTILSASLSRHIAAIHNSCCSEKPFPRRNLPCFLLYASRTFPPIHNHSLSVCLVAIRRALA